MKKKIINILIILVFIIGFLVFSYPVISNQWNKINQSKAIAGYQEAVENISEDQYEEMWESAKEYNNTFNINTFDTQIFDSEHEEQKDSEYWRVLDVTGTGIMGYISIPKINQKLAIYHGVSDSVIQIAVGHMPGTKLPIGGDGNHSVLAGHRGLPSAKLFTDIDKLTEGDKFYIHVLGKTLAYQVDQILPMVDKNDSETLTEAMQNIDGEDHVTLFTCTPYGVNSHRLLVRGVRTEYYGEDEETENFNAKSESMVQQVQGDFIIYIILMADILIIIYVLAKKIIINGNRRKQTDVSGEEKKVEDKK